jgi:hypothetical protein
MELKNLTKNGTDQAGWMPSRPLARIANCFFLLHPALPISLGVQRVSSSYFSLSSEESVADLLSQFGDDNAEDSTTSEQLLVLDHRSAAANVLYYDILMHAFTFVNAQSLASFLETAQRTNFEVFYFLQ